MKSLRFFNVSLVKLVNCFKKIYVVVLNIFLWIFGESFYRSVCFVKDKEVRLSWY